jgi:hypothetical protein
MIGQPSSFSASSYTPGGGGDGGGVDLALVFRPTWMSYRLDLCFFARNGCDRVLQECRHRTIGASPSHIKMSKRGFYAEGGMGGIVPVE